MLLTKNLSNVCLKKIIYQFIKLFEVKDIIERQIY